VSTPCPWLWPLLLVLIVLFDVECPPHDCANALLEFIHHTHTTVLQSSFRTTRVSRCRKKSSSGFYGAREYNRGKNTDYSAGHHSIQTNQQPTSLIPPFLHLRRMPFLLQPSHCILLWDRHQICWLAYTVAWLVPLPKCRWFITKRCQTLEEHNQKTPQGGCCHRRQHARLR